MTKLSPSSLTFGYRGYIAKLTKRGKAKEFLVWPCEAKWRAFAVKGDVQDVYDEIEKRIINSLLSNK